MTISQYCNIYYGHDELQIRALFKDINHFDFILLPNNSYQCSYLELLHNLLNNHHPSIIILTTDEPLNETHKKLLGRFHANHTIQLNHTQELNTDLIEQLLINFIHSMQYMKDPDAFQLNFLQDKTLMIVDDNETNIYALCKLFESIGVNVISANSVKQCMEILKENRQIDLILMDIMMPEVTGLEGIEMIRNKYQSQSPPIIIQSAKAMHSDKINALIAGANNYVTKPIDEKKLMQAILQLI